MESLPLDKLLVLAEKGTIFEQVLAQNHSFSEQGGENSTCDSSLVKDPRASALDFVQQKLHSAVLDAACKVFLDLVISQTIHEGGSVPKPLVIVVNQPTALKAQRIPAGRSGRPPSHLCKSNAKV